MQRKNGGVKKVFQENSIQFVLLLFGTFITLLNAFVASKLFPIVQNINKLESRVEATEKYVAEGDVLRERFFKIEEKVDTIKQDVAYIKIRIDKLPYKGGE